MGEFAACTRLRLSTGGRHDVEQEIDRDGLGGAVGPDHAVRITGPNFEVEMSECAGESDTVSGH